MKPQDRIQAEVADAMKQRDTARLSTLRMLLNTIKNEKIARGEDIDDKAFIGIVRKAIKQRKEAAELYEKGGREELAAKEAAEAEILAVYLPPELDEATIRAAITEFAAAESLSGPQAIGQVMKAMMAKFQGQADGAVVSRIAREVLS